MEILIWGMIQMIEKDVAIMSNMTDDIHYVYNVCFKSSFL